MIPKSTDGKTRVLSLSYGKDSMACLGAIEKLGWTLDRIVTADVWATDTIPADLPPMVEFKDYADKVIKERYGIEVEHFYAKTNGEKYTFEKVFYKRRKNGNNIGAMTGYPLVKGCEAQKALKIPAIYASQDKNSIQYIGIAADEPNRFHNLSETILSPLVEIGWTEANAKQWCIDNGLLSPLYKTSARGGCFFCPCQPTDQLRKLRKMYPQLWQLMLKWESDIMEDEQTLKTVSAKRIIEFNPHGRTLHDYDKRFMIEDSLGRQIDDFRWNMLEQGVQLDIFDLLREEQNDEQID